MEEQSQDYPWDGQQVNQLQLPDQAILRGYQERWNFFEAWKGQGKGPIGPVWRAYLWAEAEQETGQLPTVCMLKEERSLGSRESESEL